VFCVDLPEVDPARPKARPAVEGNNELEDEVVSLRLFIFKRSSITKGLRTINSVG
jgi:hypothetical protein